MPVKKGQGTEKLAPGKPPDRQKQWLAFSRAMQLFHAGSFVEARSLFEEAAKGPAAEVADRAKLHTRMCDRRIARSEPKLATAEDHYTYGIALMNTGATVEARRHFEAAVASDPRADHAFYALALCRGLTGDLGGAYESLKRAIELQPRNRLAARQDPEFARISARPPLDRLVYPERVGPPVSQTLIPA